MSREHGPRESALQSEEVLARIRQEARALGFSQIGVTGIDLTTAEPGLVAWLAAGFHGSMGYMAAHGLKRARPGDLVPGTVSIISARPLPWHAPITRRPSAAMALTGGSKFCGSRVIMVWTRRAPRPPPVSGKSGPATAPASDDL